jgi:hypothetical protein
MCLQASDEQRSVTAGGGARHEHARPAAVGGPGVAALRTQCAELGESAPILVVRNASDAHWAQHADVLVAESGLLVASCSHRTPSSSQPAPGTVWSTGHHERHENVQATTTGIDLS